MQSEFGSTLQSEISFIGGDAAGGTSDTETWVLGVLAKDAKRMFEFGTCTGRTAYLWARNSAPDAKIITLAADKHEDYAAAAGDGPLARRDALALSAFDKFIYSGTPVEHKITQLFSDSKRFDETPYLRQCDLIFIDGSHAYSYVNERYGEGVADDPTGWNHPLARLSLSPSRDRDVGRYLDELSLTMPLVRLHDTALVACRIAEA